MCDADVAYPDAAGTDQQFGVWRLVLVQFGFACLHFAHFAFVHFVHLFGSCVFEHLPF